MAGPKKQIEYRGYVLTIIYNEDEFYGVVHVKSPSGRTGQGTFDNIAHQRDPTVAMDHMVEKAMTWVEEDIEYNKDTLAEMIQDIKRERERDGKQRGI